MAVLSRAWDKEKILSTHEESKFRPSDSALRCSKLKLYRAQNLISLSFYYKHDAIDIADPNSMQDACHMNFVIDLAHRKVSAVTQWLEHRSAESKGLRFDSSLG